MKLLQYKITLIALLCLNTIINAQKFDKKYNQEFKVNKDVVIDVNTRYTDIEIETWKKNKVTVEATIEVDGTTNEKAKEIINNWKFNAIGNSDQVAITSKSNRLFVEFPTNSDTSSIVFDYPDVNGDIDFVFPEVPRDNIGILDSLHVVLPELSYFPEILVLPDINPHNLLFDSLSFDYERYKKDEHYLKEWQERMKKNLGKMRVELKENSIKLKENSAKLKEELKLAQEQRKKALQEYAEQRKLAMKMRKKELEQRAAERKKFVKERREIQDKRRKELAKKRIEIRNILMDREKIKIKRTIRIMAPKDAKFNMNVKYGSMRFPN